MVVILVQMQGIKFYISNTWYSISLNKDLRLLFFKTSNSNHRLKSADDMPICVLRRGDLYDHMSSRENEARFLH